MSLAIGANTALVRNRIMVLSAVALIEVGALSAPLCPRE